VLIQWAWSYLTYERGVRLITGEMTLPGWPEKPETEKGEMPKRRETEPAIRD